MLKAHHLAALAAVLFAGAVTPAHAVQVTYSTAGVFGSSGTGLLSQGGAQIRFNPQALTSVDVPPTTNAIFGSFTTIAAPPSPGITLVDTFKLTITQTAPGLGGELVFTSTVGGTIFLNNSQAFIQFDDPLSKSHRHRADSGRPTGSSKGTRRTRAGWISSVARARISTLNGEIGVDDISVVATPEPGTMAMACLALPLLGVGYLHRRRRQAAA